MSDELVSPLTLANNTLAEVVARIDELRRAMLVCEKVGGASPEQTAIITSLSARMAELDGRRNALIARLSRLSVLSHAEQIMRETNDERARDFALKVSSLLRDQEQGHDR